MPRLSEVEKPYNFSCDYTYPGESEPVEMSVRVIDNPHDAWNQGLHDYLFFVQPLMYAGSVDDCLVESDGSVSAIVELIQSFVPPDKAFE